jgi:DNA-binding transcriptional ArsR family regulator
MDNCWRQPKPRHPYQNADVVVPKCVYVRYPLMSPNTNISPNTKSTWDPSCLRLNQKGLARFQGATRRGRRASPIRDKFIAGPVDVSWVCQASRLGVKALLVGLTLWHLKGLRRSNSFTVSNLMVEEWKITPDAKRRALLKLEKAGLITVERRGKCSPRVTLVVGNTSNGGRTPPEQTEAAKVPHEGAPVSRCQGGS